MKNFILKISGTLLIGLLVVVFIGCKDQRNTNNNNSQSYPETEDIDQHNEEYDTIDTRYDNQGMDNSHHYNESSPNNFIIDKLYKNNYC